MNRVITLIVFTLVGCSSKKDNPGLSNQKFRFPVILQTNKDTSIYFTEKYIVDAWPKFVGQFKFSDSLQFNGDRERRDPITEKQHRWEMKAFDTDTLSSDGLQILADYSTSITYADKSFDSISHYYYPVYIVNETGGSKLFIAKDSYVFAIQEALDTGNYSRWHPIEVKGFDFCGNGYFRRKIQPKEFIMFLLPKYLGSDTALIRTRIKIGESVFISKPYKGTINLSQFNIKKESWFYKSLKESKSENITRLFYGAFPKDIETF